MSIFSRFLMSVGLLTGVAALASAAEPMLWFDAARLSAQATQVREALRRADENGLDPRDYALTVPASDLTNARAGTADQATQRWIDTALTQVVSRFVKDLHTGRVDPRAVGFHLTPASVEVFDAAAALRQLAASKDVAATIESMEPRPVPYKRLKAALARYRVLSREVVPDASEDAAQLRYLLTLLGDLPPGAAAANGDELTEAALVEGIKSFQRRHGLDPDGVVGKRTSAALNTPLERRVEQIELSMERWRWLSATGRPSIVVNIPQFMLLALPRENEAAEPLEMRAIVGQTYPHTRTPIFASAITQVVFQPYWDVPRSILVRELLPRIRKDPALLDRYHLEIVQGESDDGRVVASSPEAIERLAAGELRLRQRPGADNALGPVKFLMPNAFNVYLHATPERALFARPQRTFSHGCIRVSEPAALAAYVLRNAPSEWTPQAIDDALCGTQMLRVHLATPVPVIVFYATAVATRSEGVLFFDDVYGYDRKLEALLEARRTRR